MKIGINGLAIETGGGVTYLQNIISKILDISDHSICFFVSHTAKDQFDIPVDRDQLTVETIKTSGTASRMWYEQVRIPQEIIAKNIDLLYSPSEIPILWCPCKQVIANQNSNLYYDLDIEKPIQQRIREQILAHALELSQFVSDSTLFMTESARRKGTRELRVKEDSAHTVHHGVDSSFTDMSASESSDMSIDQNYILFVSTLYRHKNVHNLVKAYTRLPPKLRDKYSLVIVGDKMIEPEYTKKIVSLIEGLGIEENVTLVGRVSHQKVRSYYESAHLFVFPSLIESFGLPILEAMAFDVPVVASTNTAVPEVGGEAALYFNPNDPDQMSVTIERALDDEDLRNGLISRGRERVDKFTWQRCAQKTVDIFESIVDSSTVVR